MCGNQHYNEDDPVQIGESIWLASGESVGQLLDLNEEYLLVKDLE